jgi:hypothetical protein
MVVAIRPDDYVILPQGLARELPPRPGHVTVAMDAKARHVTMGLEDYIDSNCS